MNNTNLMRKKIRKRWAALKESWFGILAIEQLIGVPMLTYRLIRSELGHPARRDKPVSVLCISRESFEKDIQALGQRTSLKYLSLGFKTVERLSRFNTPPESREQTHYELSRTGRARRSREKNSRFWHFLLQRLVRDYKVGAVLSANIDYWQDGGLRDACKRTGIPFLVLSREHVVIPKSVEFVRDRYASLSYNFNGAGVAVFGPQTRDVLVETGVVTAERIWVTGAPRMDGWRDRTSVQDDASGITLLAYYGKGYRARAHYEGVLRSLAILSSQVPGPRFAVKFKKAGAEMEHSKQLIEDVSHRIDFVAHEPLYDLFSGSRVIIGFNSLALIEALLSDAEIVVPNWGETARNLDDLMLDPSDALTRNVMRFPTSLEQMQSILRDALHGAPVRSDNAVHERRQLFRRFFEFPEQTTCSEQVEKFILHFMREADQKAGIVTKAAPTTR